MVSTKTSRKAIGMGKITQPPAPPTTSRRVDMKSAAQAAFAFTHDMFPEAKDLRLEELEPKTGGWSVVISFTTGEPGTLSQVMGGETPRLFKAITIDSESGKAKSLKVWKQ